jgi:predicted transcriptional regulator
MAALWAADAPMTAAQVQQQVGEDLAYNTVQTILIRLFEKDQLQRRRAGRGHEYWPARDAATTAVAQMRAALPDGTDRHAVLQRFAASLDASDSAILRELLNGSDRPA